MKPLETTETYNTVLAAYLLSKGCKIGGCKVEWVPCVLFVMEGEQLSELRQGFSEISLEEMKETESFMDELQVITQTQLQIAYKEELEKLEKKYSEK